MNGKTNGYLDVGLNDNPFLWFVTRECSIYDFLQDLAERLISDVYYCIKKV